MARGAGGGKVWKGMATGGCGWVWLEEGRRVWLEAMAGGVVAALGCGCGCWRGGVAGGCLDDRLSNEPMASYGGF